ncbi:hypothetical protein [Streptomyces sp. NPDC002402]
MMPGSQFSFPDEVEFRESLGVMPQPFNEDGTAFFVSIESGTGETLQVSWDVMGCSVRCQILRVGEVLIDLFREGTSGLTLRSEKSAIFIVAHYEIPGLAGELCVQALPTFQVVDNLLLA